MAQSACRVLASICAVLGAVGTGVGAPQPATVPGTSLVQRRFVDAEPIRRDPVVRWKVRSVAGAAKEEWTNCVVHAGVMYGTARDVLHAIDVEKGELLWTVKGPGGHPAIEGDTLYAAGADRFYAVDLATGKVKWETPSSPMLCGWTQSHGFMKPATVIADGVAYFGTSPAPRSTATTTPSSAPPENWSGR